MKKKYMKLINKAEDYGINFAGIVLGLFVYFNMSSLMQNLDKFKFSTMFRDFSSVLLQILGFLVVLFSIIDIFWTIKHRKVKK